MDHLTIQVVQALQGRGDGWRVSLYMPAHRAGRDIEQDPIRFKNLLKEAEDRLLEKGMRSPDVRALLEPAQNLLQDPDFWRFQSDGLAAFISAEGVQTYRLPLDFEELVVISDRFHLKPLLPYFARHGHFYILALSQNQVRVLEGTRHTVDEIQVENMPETMAEALQYERFIEQVQFHTRTDNQGGNRPGVFHGHDAADEEKNRILRWLERVDEELMKMIAGENSPLVLAGVEYYFPIYQQASDYPHLVEGGMTGSPDRLSPEELHEGTWPLVRPIFEQAQKDALEQYGNLSATEQTTTDVREAVLAAAHGRVDTLFVPVGVQVWGMADPDNNKVDIHRDHDTGDEDLLDLAAIQTLANGGAVFALPANEIPGGAQIAAVLRY